MKPVLYLLIPALMHSMCCAEIRSLPGCKLETMRGADGDSFPVRFPNGQLQIVRLYGVDCLEAKIWDEADSRRLREQRRYFGITKCRPTALASITEAKNWGKKAATEVETLLAQPFTVHTTFADGRGSGYHKRIYAFITTASGHDLGGMLVREGLARAYGVCRQNHRRQSRDDVRALLEDLELRAASLGKGVWSLTDWDQFTIERAAQRQEEAELAIAIDRASTTSLVNPNTAPRDELMTLPGVGETVALRIIENRPYQSPNDLLKVKGLGEATLRKIKPRLPQNL